MLLKDYIQNISREGVVDGVKNIKRYHIASKRILSDNNPLIKNGPKSVINHGDNTRIYNIAQPKINSFLAASSLSHLLDGWIYLSHAFKSILNGDEATAIHLAYYAELRSAMSILATEGLGVFNNQHLGIFSPTSSKEFPVNGYKNKGTPPILTRTAKPYGTHTFTWDAISELSKSPTKLNTEILKIFKVSGKNFLELTQYFHPATAGSTILTSTTIKKWLKEWCLDIKMYRGDRDNRNEVSYRPQKIKNFNGRIDFQTILNDLEKYWLIISPSNTDKFDMLDKYLLRKLYSAIYPRLGTLTPKIDLIRDAFNEHGINDEILFKFLDFQSPYSDDHLIFHNANAKKTDAMSILARATLLLRISIGLVSQLYKDGGVSKNELDFVWENYGIESGFWETSNTPSDFTNLWSDIQPSLSDLISDINLPGSRNDLFLIKERQPEAMQNFGQINRACLWGMDF